MDKDKKEFFEELDKGEIVETLEKCKELLTTKLYRYIIIV